MSQPRPDSDRIAILEDQIARLETHIAHMEAAHQDMSDVLARQWGEIDRLTRTVTLLHQQISQSLPTPDAQKPPHY